MVIITATFVAIMMLAIKEENSGSGQALSPGISSEIEMTSEDHQNVGGKTHREVV